MRNCKFCHVEMKNAVHERWCKSNPKLDANKKHLSAAIAIGASDRTKKAWKDGKYDHVVFSNNGRPHTPESKEKISQGALNSNHRRLVRSIRTYVKKDGTVVELDSSWEELLAKRLDDLDVEWHRPQPMKWIDSTGKKRNYFPDFYLPEFDLYLDPKNPAAFKQQHEKVSWLKLNVQNLVFLTTLEEIKNYSPHNSTE